MIFTNRQIEILRIIQAGNDDGSMCSVYDVMDRLSTPARRDSVAHSINKLVSLGFLERKDREKRPNEYTVRVYCITTLAAAYL